MAKPDRRMWKMSPERLEQHLQLKNRARTIPDKRKEKNKKACRRDGWQAFGHFSERVAASVR
ncbi:hypothetical protein [Corynebacterium pseudotuberculosis]|uniref:Uncharacterized protein n=2 Tax=Corynebacterium pseudotuberculosis TaxID=1719 RepID=D9QCU9_CORP2|nr:hypothetical protein [Corynebacterium pseudotuberculosis]ADL11375.2 hypothetical protein CPC231_09740 [Corynebacterium pseudotuberculosis C231]ADL21786.1 hypothetical protein CP1002_03400 [Corynebacterium pseudotuberculosis 1002]ADO27184.1 hypothetical protein CPI19_09765 [Corynebacterium pseudotuberculosis I19]AEK93246.1 Hypothetical protein CpPAT10_1936 [Corynebacterium pseudotuberculosis PAT10]AEP71152.1 Hypothetical protein Cp4202_1923 [Corynebacterium pseudotuberculosis 42/02-A]